MRLAQRQGPGLASDEHRARSGLGFQVERTLVHLGDANLGHALLCTLDLLPHLRREPPGLAILAGIDGQLDLHAPVMVVPVEMPSRTPCSRTRRHPVSTIALRLEARQFATGMGPLLYGSLAA